MNVPAELKYNKSHEWVRVEGDVAVIGITDFAQAELGDIVYVDLPEAGKALKAGETFGTVESVKTVSDVYAPVSGEVVEANGALTSASELVNSDAFGEGWMIKIKMANPSELGGLLDADGYKASVEA